MTTTRFRELNPIDRELRRRTGVIIRWNLMLWPLGLLILAILARLRIAG